MTTYAHLHRDCRVAWSHLKAAQDNAGQNSVDSVATKGRIKIYPKINSSVFALKTDHLKAASTQKSITFPKRRWPLNVCHFPT